MKKDGDIEDVNEIFRNFMKIVFTESGSFFGNFFSDSEEQPIKSANLKNGFSLKYLETPTPRGMVGNYGILCKDGIPISKEIFRTGGLCSGFKDGYCMLILYKPDKSVKEGYDFGTHVIVDETGKVCLKAENMLRSPHHLKGVVATLDNTYYNLKTGEIILDGKYSYLKSTSLSSESYLFIEGRVDRKDVVYQIDFKTGECITYY